MQSPRRTCIIKCLEGPGGILALDSFALAFCMPCAEFIRIHLKEIALVIRVIGFPTTGNRECISRWLFIRKHFHFEAKGWFDPNKFAFEQCVQTSSFDAFPGWNTHLCGPARSIYRCGQQSA